MACVHEHFFLFKQKTAYEMRISDWSSDVCSSDLPTYGVLIYRLGRRACCSEKLSQQVGTERVLAEAAEAAALLLAAPVLGAAPFRALCRSEERRVGKECVSTCRSVGSWNN